MWPAHLLTLSRIPIAIGFWWASGFWAVALVVAAALTDTLDGNVARWLRRRGHDRPDIGGWLDPVVDKLFVVIVVAALWRTVDPLILLLLATREILLVVVAIMYLARAGARSIRDLHADRLGKVATISQFVGLAIVLALPQWGLVAAGVAGVLGFAAAIHYWRAVDRMHRYTRPASQRDMSTTASSAR
jgi:cardiolipin synthase